MCIIFTNKKINARTPAQLTQSERPPDQALPAVAIEPWTVLDGSRLLRDPERKRPPPDGSGLEHLRDAAGISG
jgi:hypothetical protein